MDLCPLRSSWRSTVSRCPSPTPTRSYSPAFQGGRGLTKMDLMRYYLRVADGALRGVADRPMILKRFVKGITEEADIPEARTGETA